MGQPHPPLGYPPRLKRDTDPDAAVLPILREVSDEWAMAKDGRSWFGQHIPKLMRK